VDASRRLLMGRRTKALVVLMIGLAACGQAYSSPTPRKAGTDETLYVATTVGLQLVSSPSGRVVATVPSGVAAADNSVVISTEPRRRSTLVTRVDPAGARLSSWLVEGDVVARVVSPLGAQIALVEASSPGSSTYAPEARARTRIVVAEAGGRTNEFDLDGNFEPEAFSTDGRELFLLEYIPARAPTKYRVRRLLLDKERVLPIGRLKTAAPQQMQGTGRAQVYAPGADELYTLYTQQESAGHETGAFSGDHAFVHLLNLRGSWTHCIDLPHTFGHGDATASALAVSPDGTRLFVADWTSGIVAAASPRKGKVTDTASVSFGEADDRTFADATNDRLFVAGGAEVVVLDPDTLQVVGRWPLDAEITGLAASEDGRRLHVSTSDQITTLETSDGKVQAEVRVEGASGLAPAAAAS
jgi:hypothetical protein